MTVTNWYSCWCVGPVYVSHQYCFLHNYEKLPCDALKIKNINWRLQTLGNLFRCRSHDKCVVKHLKPWLEQLHVSICHCAPPSDSFVYFLLLLTVSCLPQNSYVRMPSISSHNWIPMLWWVYDAIVGEMLKMFFSHPCDLVQTPVLSWVMANHFLVLMRCLLCLRYGPCVCNKSVLL